MSIFSIVIPILMTFFKFLAFKVYYIALRHVLPRQSQSSANEKRYFIMTSGLRQYIAGFNVANFLTLFNSTSRYIRMRIRIYTEPTQTRFLLSHVPLKSLFISEQSLFCIMVYRIIQGLNHRYMYGDFKCGEKSNLRGSANVRCH